MDNKKPQINYCQTVIDILNFMCDLDTNKVNYSNGVGFNRHDAIFAHDIQRISKIGFLTEIQLKTIANTLQKYHRQHKMFVPSEVQIRDSYVLYVSKSKKRTRVEKREKTYLIHNLSNDLRPFIKELGGKDIFDNNEYIGTVLNIKAKYKKLDSIRILYTLCEYENRFKDWQWDTNINIELCTKDEITLLFTNQAILVDNSTIQLLYTAKKATQMVKKYKLSNRKELRKFLFSNDFTYKGGFWYVTISYNWYYYCWDKLKLESLNFKVDSKIYNIFEKLNNLMNKRLEYASKAILLMQSKPCPINDFQLYEYQKDWFNSLNNWYGHILAFDMGLGKTLMGCLWAYYYNSITSVNFTTSTTHIYIIKPKSVISWNQMFEMEPLNTLSYSIHTWAKIPEPEIDKDYIVIADESHYTQDPKSKRSQAYRYLCEYALGVLNLSGTPSKNGTMRDIYTQCRAIGGPNSQTRQNFINAYGWQDDMNLNQFRQDYHHLIHYKHKSEVLDLPSKTREHYYIELDEQHKKLRQDRYDSFMASYRAKFEAGLISGNLENLVELSGLRLATALGKVQGCYELLDEIISQGSQCAVFCDFREPLNILESMCIIKEINFISLYSRDNQERRRQKQEQFKQGTHKVFLSTFKCGGEGIDLTPCQYAIFIDRPWTSAVVLQAEDRMHRIGQTHNLTIYWLYWNDPEKIEERVENVIYGKQQNINTLLGSNIIL